MVHACWPGTLESRCFEIVEILPGVENAYAKSRQREAPAAA
ncbi:darcynin family protein [Paraburkholderia aromaticivorans]